MTKPAIKKPAAKPATTKPATTKPAANSKAPNLVDGIFVRSLPERFRRAGFDFNREGFGLILADLTKEQLKAIDAEPMLNVQRVEIPATVLDDAALAGLAADEETSGAEGGVETPPASTETPPGEA